MDISNHCPVWLKANNFNWGQKPFKFNSYWLDGYSFCFLKNGWETVKANVFRFVKEFYANARLSKVVTTSFLMSIPKVLHPQSLNNYRPICLVSCLQKILACRLKTVLGKIIPRQQSAFVPGRNTSNSVLVVN